jgi:hypothetical protein
VTRAARVGFAALALASLAVTVIAGGPLLAHVEEHVGPYTLELGWREEPTYVGHVNAVLLIVLDADGDPVADLAPGDLTVVVSTGGQDSVPLTLEPSHDPDEGGGVPGEYQALLLPTAPGDYTFHVTGTIRDQAVDVSVTSGEETFDPVQGTADIEFPATLPTVPEIVTRLDRIDGRIEETVRLAYLAGTGLGLAGLLVGVLGAYVALRARRRAA